MRRLGLVLAAAAALGCEPPSSPPPGTRAALEAIQPARVRAHMAFLADDLLEGRRAGTRGYELAAKYVAAQLESMGLEPAGEDGSYFQRVPLRSAVLDAEKSSLVLRSGEGRRTLRYGEDYLLDAPFARESHHLSAPLVFAGYGISAPERGHEDYEGLDVEGKIVVALTGAPPAFGSTERAVYSSSQTKAAAALERGAAGLLFIRTPIDEARRPWELLRRHAGSPSMHWLDPGSGRPAAPTARLEVTGFLAREAAARIFSNAATPLEGIFASSTEGTAVPRFPLSMEVDIELAGSFEDIESPNVVAKLRGTGGELAAEHVVYSAHLDHVGVGAPVDGDAIYNGAYDNASGVSVLLTVAEAFTRLDRPPSRSLLFLAVTAEEEGLLGSDYFATHPTVPRDSIVANINTDGVLMFHPLEDIVAFGAQHSTLLDPVSSAAAMMGIELSPDFMPEEVIFVRSDQYSFVRQGVPSVYAFVGTKTGDPALDGERILRDWMATVYHKPTDDMSQDFDFEAGAEYARLQFLIGHLVAEEEERPSWLEGDFLGERFASKTTLLKEFD